MTTHTMTLLLHSSLGGFALITYWIAALARKGSTPHKLAGRLYLLVMLGLLVPAVPLSLRVLLDKSPEFGWFLFYLLLITATAMWQGWFASRHKRDFSRYAGRGFRVLAWLNLLAGVAVLGLGLAKAQPIFLGFSLVGLLGGRRMLGLAARGPAHPQWWKEQHIGAMLGCGVATHIAFLSIGLPKLMPALAGQTMSLVAWLAPLFVAGVARVWLRRSYLRAATGPASKRTPVAAGAR